MISVAIFTYNEEINLPYCLESLGECDDIVVVDSFSSDRTCEIARQKTARVFQHIFTGFGDQRMWALENISFNYPWVLILDADERVTPELWQEMKERILTADEDVGAFSLKRRFFWEGVWLQYANLYPSWIVRLVQKDKVTFFNRGHAETQKVNGKIEFLVNDLIDENYKGLNAWRERQWKYAEQEAQYEVTSINQLKFFDLWDADPFKRRTAWKTVASKLPFRSLSYFAYSYFIRSGWKDGLIGFRFCIEKARFQQHISRLIRKINLK